MGVPKRLTEKQIKFAQLVVSNEGRMNGTECAKEAGYGEAARIRAYELQNPKKYPLVVKYIGELRAENQKKYDVTYGRHITELAKIRQEALRKGAWSAAVNAEVARGKAAGLYIEQKIIRTGKLDDLSEEELEKRMAEIIDQYARILEGVEEKDLKAKVKEKQKEIRLNPKEKEKSKKTKPLQSLKKVTNGIDSDPTSKTSS